MSRPKQLYVIEVKVGKQPWKVSLDYTTTYYDVAKRTVKMFTAPKHGWQARIVRYVPKENQ